MTFRVLVQQLIERRPGFTEARIQGLRRLELLRARRCARAGGAWGRPAELASELIALLDRHGQIRLKFVAAGKLRLQACEIISMWLVPFQNYKTFCPYLVGGYERVARELARYLEVGYRTFILDIPREEDDLRHSNVALELARRQVFA